jgi:hypothetical protein
MEIIICNQKTFDTFFKEFLVAIGATGQRSGQMKKINSIMKAIKEKDWILDMMIEQKLNWNCKSEEDFHYKTIKAANIAGDARRIPGKSTKIPKEKRDDKWPFEIKYEE